jgi:hypothetical protein
MRPFRATSAPPPPHYDLLSTMALTTGTLVAVRDSPDSVFHLARITTLTEANASLHYLGTTNPRIERAVFKLLWLSPTNKTVLKDTRPARNHSQPYHRQNLLRGPARPSRCHPPLSHRRRQTFPPFLPTPPSPL